MLDGVAEAKDTYGSTATQIDYAKTLSNVGSRGVHALLCLLQASIRSLRVRSVIVDSGQMAGAVLTSRVMMGCQRVKVIVQQGSLLALAIQVPCSAEVVRHSLQVLRSEDEGVEQQVVVEGYSVALVLQGQAKCLRVLAREEA